MSDYRNWNSGYCWRNQGTCKNLGVTEMVFILTGVVVTQVYTFVKIQIVHLKIYTICIWTFYLNKNKQNKILTSDLFQIMYLHKLKNNVTISNCLPSAFRSTRWLSSAMVSKTRPNFKSKSHSITKPKSIRWNPLTWIKHPINCPLKVYTFIPNYL